MTSPDAVQISFQCLPLRTVGRLDIPLDASEQQAASFQRIKQAIQKHGTLNSYYLLQGSCVFHLTNDPQVGMLAFVFEGPLLTDQTDRQTRLVELDVRLTGETCPWLTKPVLDWFEETVRRAVAVEFDRYIAAGDLEKTLQRIERIRASSEEDQGYLGMYL